MKSFLSQPVVIILRKWSSHLFSRYFAHVENLTMDEEQGERKNGKLSKLLMDFFDAQLVLYYLFLLTKS